VKVYFFSIQDSHSSNLEEIIKMKGSAIVFAACVASASAFAPTSQPKFDTSLNESLFAKIANMDLWAPVKESNDYGARNKKNVSYSLSLCC